MEKKKKKQEKNQPPEVYQTQHSCVHKELAIHNLTIIL